ncbi:MAG: FumA C-terminus/TtdB family hydratase beta subunit [Planctomycetaceae bacterium]|nr:FumA C-terminus/TtdB family hydratase beta subunit [Planctomycetaceae bacterium]
MSAQVHIQTPLTDELIARLHAGDEVLISGVVLTARDQAHKRLCTCLEQGRPLPVELRGSVIYFVGPTPALPGKIIGAAGPTTSSRMDAFTPALLAGGLKGTIGKGYRSRAVRDAIVQYKAVHFSALGGAAALLNRYITDCRVIAYHDLGPEAIHQLKFHQFPAVVAYDSYGNSVYNE